LSKIVKKNSKIHLYIAGNVPQNHNIRQMARDLKIDKKIIFTGHLMPQKYHRLLNSVDILLLPSKNEGLPISLLEAMAMGKSIIASNRGGIPEIIIDKRNGILVEPISDEVTDAILYIYKNNDFKKKIEYNNLQDIKKFDWDCIIDKYMIIYYKVVSNN
jgi:glycosyltransferase involved in cell wall biosynthesis